MGFILGFSLTHLIGTLVLLIFFVVLRRVLGLSFSLSSLIRNVNGAIFFGTFFFLVLVALLVSFIG
jgi:hypothetical protein